MLTRTFSSLLGLALLTLAVSASGSLEKKIAAAEAGDPIAMIELGRIYKVGEIVSQDHDESDKWARRAIDRFEALASEGDLDAKLGLGLLHLSEDVIEVDFVKGSELIYDAAKKGHVDSQYHHAALLADERFNERVSGRFYFWMRKAAKGGNLKAQKLVAFCCYEGWFRNRNPKESLSWWLQAAEQGDAESQFNAGLMYYRGEGTKRNYQEAINQWRKAAKQGDASAHHNLGAMHYNGIGTMIDNGLASSHFAKARELGFERQEETVEPDSSADKSLEDRPGHVSKSSKARQGDSDDFHFVHLEMYLPRDFKEQLIRSSSYAFNGPPTYLGNHPRTEVYGYDEATSTEVVPRQLILESERAQVRREQAEALKTWRESQRN